MNLLATFHITGLVLIVGLAGMISHYLKQFVRKEIDGSLIDYFVRDHARNSVAALMGFGAAAAGAILTHTFDGMTAEQVIMGAFTLGYTCDSALNKGAATSPSGPDVAPHS